MKGWPENGEPADFSALADPICEALRFAYSLRRRNADVDIPWAGPEIGRHELATCHPAAHALSAENLRYSEEEQGRDALMEIVGLALRLGIEQGRRISFGSSERQELELLRRLLADMRTSQTGGR